MEVVADAVKRVCARVGGTTSLARMLGMKPPTVHQWASGSRPVPPASVPALVSLGAGDVHHWQLRPLDWHRIWPELIGTEGAPAVPAEEARDAA